MNVHLASDSEQCATASVPPKSASNAVRETYSEDGTYHRADFEWKDYPWKAISVTQLDINSKAFTYGSRFTVVCSCVPKHLPGVHVRISLHSTKCRLKEDRVTPYRQHRSCSSSEYRSAPTVRRPVKTYLKKAHKRIKRTSTPAAAIHNTIISCTMIIHEETLVRSEYSGCTPEKSLAARRHMLPALNREP